MEQKLRAWIEKEKEELNERKKKSDYKPEINYIQGRLDALYLLEKVVQRR